MEDANQQVGLQAIYVLQRDSKHVLEYNIATKKVFKRTVNIPAAFPHNFAYV